MRFVERLFGIDERNNTVDEAVKVAMTHLKGKGIDSKENFWDNKKNVKNIVQETYDLVVQKEGLETASKKPPEFYAAASYIRKNMGDSIPVYSTFLIQAPYGDYLRGIEMSSAREMIKVFPQIMDELERFYRLSE